MSRHVRDDLVALLDGALDAERAGEVARHLEGCEPCRAERDRLARALGALAALPPPPAPSAAFAARLEARLAEERARPRGLLARLRTPRLQLAASAAAMLLVAAVAFAAIRREQVHALTVAADLDLYEDYEVIAGLGDVASAEDAHVVAQLHELMKEGEP